MPLVKTILFGLVMGLSVRSAACTQVDQEFKLYARADFVLLDVSVRNSKGAFVTGLNESNFKAFEDGRLRVISHFAAFDAPVALGLVVDNSGSMLKKRGEVIAAGLAFVQESNPKDKFFVINFNDSVTRGLPPSVPFTDNLRLLKSALYFGEPRGQTALYDAIGYSLKHLERSPEQRRTLIVVSDGGDNVSRMRFPELIKAVHASQATIYTIGIYDRNGNDLNPGVLRKIANISGGAFFEPSTAPEIGPVFKSISQDIRHRYTIGYVPDEINDKRQVRTIKVTAQQGGRKLNVHTRTSYSVR